MINLYTGLVKLLYINELKKLQGNKKETKQYILILILMIFGVKHGLLVIKFNFDFNDTANMFSTYEMVTCCVFISYLFLKLEEE